MENYDARIAEIRGENPSMRIPVLCAGWGGYNCTTAIFKVCPEYIGNRKIVVVFDSQSLVSLNEGEQQKYGSGFTVESLRYDEEIGGLLTLHIDPMKVKETISLGDKEWSTKEKGCEYAIAFYCKGDIKVGIFAKDENNEFEELYTRTFYCD